ncbi:17S U2 SnRNP complex component HTATSF1-like [Ptychodera flava]|uniref:17S U2 SnRNP complex component HTATSF1-like n=1 Tax=Ptychodera flava TaxID=63121 RepID=UPI00396A8F47
MDEFEEQLQLQKIAEERQKLQAEGADDPYTYTDPNDGTVYEWDSAKQAWFPKIDEDFIANYQANYGTHVDNTSETPSESQQSTSTQPTAPSLSSSTQATANSSAAGKVSDSNQQQQTNKGQKRKADEGWFEMEDSKNKNVYVSGLPEDIMPEEFQEMMSKCGIIMLDEQTGEPKIKLYTDHLGNRKGDGRCCYLKRESVDLAMQILDGSDVRGHTISVQLAKFQPKGNYDPSLKKKKKKKKQRNVQEKLLEWRPERSKMMGNARLRHESVVILKNMFNPSEFEEDPMAINEIRDDLKAECGKFGEVKKVTIFDRHPDGVASIKFKEAEEADQCIAALNGRWFAQKRIIALQWDGTTDYQVEETEKERDQRLQKWEKFLEDKKTDPLETQANEQSSNHGNQNQSETSTRTETQTKS